jgi:2-keto-myo-inositol isomerase
MQFATPSRREWLAGTIAAGLVVPAASGSTDNPEPFGYCLNTATIRGQKLSLVDQVETAARAGFRGIEPWVRDLEEHVKGGGDLRDVRKRIGDRGLTVESAIAFSEWAVDDDERRRKGLEQARKDMALVAQIGGKRIAAPPAGVTDRSDLNLSKVAERYRALLEIGASVGVVPQVELWGFSRLIRRVGEAMQVALDSNHPKACVLLDVYHLYKGGSDFGWVHLLGPGAFGVLHVNDYPAKPPRAEINDSHRVYPGDGVAPLVTFLRDLHAIGFRGMLSLELFNREYWGQDALVVARTGLEKLRAVVRQAMAVKP